ncbi:MAG TPA: Nif3-like dinuclear metal center hexameric protein [Solirubrobacteraceae bacterium]|jgi:dinuclear metal center YbgI/SA1388 family protein|nr:Nif3-like dinuclear metal center hexameric protein [Solirubrobacteraceae bacterium]
MPTTTSEIIAELDVILEPSRFEDYCVNGLQVPGADQIQTIATGVSAHADLFDLAAEEQAQLLLVHHGLFWGSGVTAIDPLLKRRLQLLFDAGIALAAYHLPLDAHPEFGNNALLASALGASGPGGASAESSATDAACLTPFALHRGQPIGCLATLPGDGLPAQELFARVREITNREPLVFDAGPPRIRRVAIVSGAGADYTQDAAAAGADALLTGEPAERSMALARESGIHVIAAGHYATETFGVKALGAHLAERFDLRHVFLDVPNPV